MRKTPEPTNSSPAGHKNKLSNYLPGLLITLAFAIISFLTWWLLKGTWLKFSALLWAFIYSIVAVNALPALFKTRFARGIDFASTRLLRIAIALLGLTFSASVWIKLGGEGVAVVLINLVIVFLLGLFFCKYILKLDIDLAILITAGTTICGASAIAAVGPALRAKAENMGLSVAVITLFGLIAMFLYPILFAGPLAGWLNNNPQAFSMWVGMGIHETAQVIAAASQINDALSIATSAKFIRIFMIGPLVFICLYLFQRFSNDKEKGKVRMTVPWFAVFFILFSLVYFAIESTSIKSSWVAFSSTYIAPTVTFLLAWAFAAIGFKVRLSSIKAIGLKAFLGGITVAALAGVSSLLLVKYLWLPLQP